MSEPAGGSVELHGTAFTGSGLVVFDAVWCPLWNAVVKVLGPQDALLVDVDEHPAVAEMWAVKVVPTVIAVRAGREVQRHSGAVNEKLLRKLRASAG